MAPFKGNQHAAGDSDPTVRKERTSKVRKAAGGPGVDEKLARDVRKGPNHQTQELNVGSGKKCSSCGGTVASGRSTCQNCGHSFSTLSERVAALESAVLAFGAAEFAGNAGNPDALRKWFNDGAGGKIDWGSSGDFMACVAEASKHMSAEDAKGFCNLRHQDATGGPPGHAPGE